MADIDIDIDAIRTRYFQYIGERDKIARDIDDLQVQKQLYEHSLVIKDMSRTVLEALSKLTEQDIKQYIEPLVTEALKTVFNCDMAFGLRFSFERNQITVIFNLCDAAGNKSEGNIEDMKGGGVLDVIGLVLRFILLELFNLPGIILLDEPGKFVDQQHQANFGQMILSFSEKFKRQIVIVTHDAGICNVGAKRYDVALDSIGNSIVTEIKDN